MGVVDANALHRFMSEPKWSATQTTTAEEICAQVESSLESALGGQFITPRGPRHERCPVLNDPTGTGLVDTSYPVYRVLSLDGATVGIDDDGEQLPLPSGFSLVDRKLYRPALGGGSLGTVTLAGPGSVYGTGAGRAGRYSGSVALEYMAGWGDDPGIVLALKMKAQTLMSNRHSNVVTARGLNASSPPKISPERWTEDELKPLGRYRRIAIGGA